MVTASKATTDPNQHKDRLTILDNAIHNLECLDELSII
jgi:hypothetical protein